MSSTATKTDTPRTLRLTNGKTFTFLSNQSTTEEQIPLIDISRMYSDKLEDRQDLAEEVRDAAHNVGFFSMINHDVDLKLATAVLDQAKEFFALPNGKKMEVRTDLIPDEYCGYHPMEGYNPNGWKRRDLYEAFNWNYNPAKDPDYPDLSIPQINLWPKDTPVFEETLCRYQTQMILFARKLTRMFALALHMPEDAFDDYVKRPEAGMRVVHYPQQEASRDDQNGIGAHTDVECFTIIISDGTAGLADGSNTIHRVINESGRERYSAPFFWGFDRETLLNPIPTCVSEENPPKYPLMTAGEYYLWRTRGQKKLWKIGDAHQ
ncbi:hypothetical protein B7463_g5962, partial [Scytalidium lignicola]